MALSERENYLRNATFQGPEWIPASVVINDASWDMWRYEMEKVLLRHPTLFPKFRPHQRNYENYTFGPAYRAEEDFTDAWGSVWRSDINGIEGVVVKHPLSDWEALDSYHAPDPAAQWDRSPADWAGAERRIREAKARGELTSGSVPHGFLFLRLTYLRGFENAMMDLATNEPQMAKLIETVMQYNRGLVQRWLALGVDVMELADDLGAQKSAMISPAKFRQYLMPHYRELADLSHRTGALVTLHSDGYTMDIMEDIIGAGVNIVNPQDLVNGVDEIARTCKGRVCIRLDIDRQKVLPYGSRQEIHDLIEYEIKTLGSPAGGLEMICGIYPPTPPENVDALCSAIEEFRTYWW